MDTAGAVDERRWSWNRVAILSAVAPRFLTLAEVGEILQISAAQTYALVRNQELPAIKIGGRGVWRVEAAKLEEYIARMYDETKSFIEAHPFGPGDDGAEA